MKRLILSALAVAMLSLCGLSASHAQIIGPPTGPVAPSTPAAPSAPAAQQNPAVLSQQTFEAYLNKIGRDVKSADLKNNAGQVVARTYTLTVVYKGMNIPLSINLNNGYVWMHCTLGTLKAGTSPAELQKLLEKQLATGPSLFMFRPTAQGMLVQMNHRLDRGISTERLAAGFDEYLNDIVSSQDAWKPVVQ
jgi:hypothetical protein